MRNSKWLIFLATSCVLACTDGESDIDFCPDDPNKIVPGICGCGVPDVDTTGNGILDCLESEPTDECPNDPNKTSPGICGCGIPDTIDEATGIPKCLDQCPDDPDKFLPGICGCGVSDIDTDGDGVPDCFDECPYDPDKVFPGICGCGVPDIDTDGDGVPDCIDMCPEDPDKMAPGVCGCGVPDTLENVSDDDGDGVPNCLDACPNNPTKWADPGEGGCDVLDSDLDGVDDPFDACPYNPNIQTADQGDCNIVTEGGENVFQIWSAYDLLTLKQALSNTDKPITKAVVMRDINLADLDTTSITEGSACHGAWEPYSLTKMTLDGQDHVIRFQLAHTRCQLNNALFSTVNDSSIKNLTLNYDLLGAATATLADQTSKSELQNIRYLGNLITTNSAYVGGIVATSSESKFADIHFTGNLMAPFSTRVGGIVADANKDTYDRIYTRIVTLMGAREVGGSFGYLTNTSVSHADNQVDAVQSASANLSGGFAAMTQGTTTLTQVRNTVELITGATVGGLVGQCSGNGSGTEKPAISVIQNRVGTVQGTSYGGGLCGYSTNLYLSDIDNSADVINANSYAGGLVGRTSSVKIERAKNRVGTVQATSYGGGLCGYSTSTYLSDIDNSADVTKANSRVGGMLGYGSSITIERAINAVKDIGPTTASSYVSGSGGLGGYCDSCSTESIKNTIGKVQGTDYVGGLFGETYYSTIRNVDSHVDSVQGENTVGGLLGYTYYSTIQNIDNHVDTVQGRSEVGGLLGNMYRGSIENVNNAANNIVMTSYNPVGGLGGYLYYPTIRQISSISTSRAADYYYTAGLFGYTYLSGTSLTNIYTSATIFDNSGNPMMPYRYMCMAQISGSTPSTNNVFWQRHNDYDSATSNSSFNPYFTEVTSLEMARVRLTSDMSAGDRAWEITKTDLFEKNNEVLTLKPLSLEISISFDSLDF